jgi:ABC-type nickel/cobalt efflux system permease component RcnA
MGNFSINHYTAIHVDRDSIELRYIVDIAEIPTYQEVQDAGIVTTVGDPSLRPYLTRQSAAWLKNLTLLVDNQTVNLSILSTSVIFPPGAGGLPTMKIGVVYRGVLRHKPSGALTLHYQDDNFPGHAGWKEIVVTTGEGVTLAPSPDGSIPFKTDRSSQLTDYPTNLLNSPPQDLEADLSYTVQPSPVVPAITIPAILPVAALPQPKHAISIIPSPPPIATPAPTEPAPLILAPNKQATPRNRFTELIPESNHPPTFWLLLTAALLAAGLGAAHALEPGHGKTIVAAYLVGSRGRARHAVGLGLLVTASHTAGVYVLGAIVLYASKYIVPERIYPWLSISSGLIIAAMAGYLFLRAYTGTTEASEDTDGVLHSHWYTPKSQPSSSENSAADKSVSLKQLLVLGITGGIIPCPAALVVLLSAVSLHRIGLGFFLIVAFSIGLAAVLIAIGIAMVRARSLLSRYQTASPLIKRWLPLASASAMMLAGLAIAATALPATGLSLHSLSLHRSQVPTLLWVIGLGLFLGMRHSTDPDHVVAVSTIVTRERSVKQGALIGMMWGFGHTITIFVVGALIILFKLTIPPRLGLSMEMTVAGMLILLGILNLTGVLQRITARLTPATWVSEMTLGEASPDAPTHFASASVLLVASKPFYLRAQNATKNLTDRFGYFQLLRPLAIGLVHGLAGSAAVALLVLSMIPSPAWAVMYLVVFGLGTVAGMMLMTTAMAVPMALTGKNSSRYLTFASGVVSICFGLFLVYQIGFVDGLFTSHVHWVPS